MCDSNIPPGCLMNSPSHTAFWSLSSHELCESIKDFLISAFISYAIDPISGACFVQDMVAIMTASRTASLLRVCRECVE